jgi:hypothetical protein
MPVMPLVELASCKGVCCGYPPALITTGSLKNC